jgi:hypothetical protein
MRAVRVLASTLSVLIGGYLLLLGNGVSTAIRERTQGWNITPLPSHPVAHIVVYVTLAIALQFASAWLLMPATTGKDATRFWRRYAARVGLLVAACVVVGIMILFVVMALLDSGAI